MGITINYTAGLLVYTLEVPSSFEGTTSGLLGNYNNDDSDEFVFRIGITILNSSSDRAIHQFGQSCKLIHIGPRGQPQTESRMNKDFKSLRFLNLKSQNFLKISKI